MDKMINAQVERELRQLLAGLDAPVRLLFFKQKGASCPSCERQEQLLLELCALSGKLKLEIRDLVLDGDMARNYRIERTPATAVLGERDHGIRFYGVTAGYEFPSLLEAVLLVSSGRSNLDPQLQELVKKIEAPVHLEVMVTLTCQYCPEVVRIAHEFAFLNDKVRADMVESEEFPELARKYEVTGVPKTIINGRASFTGALPAPAIYLEIVKAVAPEQYGALLEQVRSAAAGARTRRADPGHLYELAIVGGGPAAMSAAVYAARKGLDVALLAKKMGGQVNYTAGIENYLGLAEVSGAEMTDAFRSHMARHPVAEAVGENVVRIGKEGAEFALRMEGGGSYRALAVVYCAGKEYKRLGLPGEEELVGKGIGFCATCDAPLYRNKAVAVVGGGNSAFTSARDLLAYASEIHLVHRGSSFRADAALVEEVKKAPNVKLHTGMEVKAYLGRGRLTGVRLGSPDGSKSEELKVDGVFLEIGLTPNSAPVQDLARLNKFGEIEVDRAQATAEKGLFAAGDVTDTEEKQISVAVGQGAAAALAAYRYLADNGLTKSTAGRKDSWQ